jgi:hypothetical protein
MSVLADSPGKARDRFWHELEAETLLKLEAASCVAEIFFTQSKIISAFKSQEA